MNHPLKNPSATHYQKANRDEVLDELRQMEVFSEVDLYNAKHLPKRCDLIDVAHSLLTTEELKAVCKFMLIKYTRDKGQDEADLVKSNDYKNFLQWLDY